MTVRLIIGFSLYLERTNVISLINFKLTGNYWTILFALFYQKKLRNDASKLRHQGQPSLNYINLPIFKQTQLIALFTSLLIRNIIYFFFITIPILLPYLSIYTPNKKITHYNKNNKNEENNIRTSSDLHNIIIFFIPSQVTSGWYNTTLLLLLFTEKFCEKMYQWYFVCKREKLFSAISL